MKNKQLMTKVLEHWYAIDSILFNDHAKYVIKEGSMFREYVSLKQAMLSSLYEYYSHIQYNPEYNTPPVEVKALVESARVSALYGKKLASNIINKEDVRKALGKKIVKEARERNITDVDGFSDHIVNEKFVQISLDNILVGIPVMEAVCPKCCNDVKGQVMEDAYRMLRQNLMDLAASCTKTSLKG